MNKHCAGVVLICHPDYAKYIHAAVTSIEEQSLPFSRKVLVWDGDSELLPRVPHGWTLCVMGAGNPNAARNMGLHQALECEWLVFWDADNVMPQDYHARAYGAMAGAERAIGVLYPQVWEVDKYGKRLACYHKGQAWSRQLAQSRSICDTGSFWRTEAVCEVGGWDAKQCRHDDYSLALRIFRAGWRGQALNAEIEHLQHGQNRSKLNDCTESLFTAWHFAFVTLWSGADMVSSVKILEWLVKTELPPHAHLYWVDNSGHTFSAILAAYASLLRNKVASVTIIDGGPPYRIKEGESYRNPARHKHVAYLYNLVLPMVREEIVCFLEDDTLPPEGGLKTLLSIMAPSSKVAISAGVYRSRPSPAYICASRDKTKWASVPRFDHLPAQPFEVGMTGMGFALCANWALQECLPVTCHVGSEGNLLGWDANLGMALTAQGYKMLAHPSVKCNHLCVAEPYEKPSGNVY